MVKIKESKYLFFVIFCIVFFICDFTVDVFGKYCQRNLPVIDSEISKINYVVTSLNSDAVIIGSSTANRHYNPTLLKNVLDSVYNQDMEIYNAGLDGHFLKYHSCFIESILSRGFVKTILWDTRDTYFYSSDEDLPDLYPYYKSNVIVHNYLDQCNTKEKVKLLSNSFRYNSSFLRYLKCLFSQNDNSNGYHPLDKHMTQEDAKKYFPKSTSEQDSLGAINHSNIELFKRTLLLCKNQGVDVIIIGSPVYGSINGNVITSEICKQMEIPFFDFRNSKYFNAHPKLFKDTQHLNNDGAKIFNRMLCDSLKIIYNHTHL